MPELAELDMDMLQRLKIGAVMLKRRDSTKSILRAPTADLIHKGNVNKRKENQIQHHNKQQIDGVSTKSFDALCYPSSKHKSLVRPLNATKRKANVIVLYGEQPHPMDGSLAPDCCKPFVVGAEADGDAPEGQLAVTSLPVDTRA